MRNNIEMKHPIEDDDSWNAYRNRQGSTEGASNDSIHQEELSRRRLSHKVKSHNRSGSNKHHAKDDDDNDNDIDPVQLEYLKFEEDLRSQQVRQKSEDEKRSKAEKKRLEAYNAVYKSPGIARTSVHGLMVSSVVSFILEPSVNIIARIVIFLTNILHSALRPIKD